MNNQEHFHDHFQYLSEMGGEAVRLTWFAIETQYSINIPQERELV